VPRAPHHLLIAAGIAIITSLCLSACLANTITTWDDTAYLRDDIFIKDLSWQGLRAIFTHPVMGNYHPLTILSFAIEYSLVQLEPWLYHFDSLVLHIVASLLVYWLVWLLTKRPVAAVVTALLFAIHPMHTESVAWVSGRKDVLYAVFYLAACIAWVGYLRAAHRRGLWYALVLALFLCALLSKAVAATLPLTLLLIDYFERGRITRKDVMGKLPHFALAVLFGIISVQVQQTAGAMSMLPEHFNAIERLALGCYALTTYLWKAVLPLGQHCLYPYPLKVQGSLPLYFYIYPLIIAALAALLWVFARRSRVAVFGLLFFMANIALLLQFLQVGQAIVAERYTYIPYIGLFFIAGWWAAQRPRIAGVAVAACIGIYGYLAAQRCPVWYDEFSLWSDEIAHEPVLAPQAYNNLGFLYGMRMREAATPAESRQYYDSAMYLLNKAIEVRPAFLNPYIAMGDMQRSRGDNAAAKSTFFRALRLHPDDAGVALELAICYYVDKNYDSAGVYFRRELQLDSSSPAQGNYANFLEATGKNDSALLHYNKAIAMSNTNYVLYANRAKLNKKTGHWDDALRDLNTALRMNPDLGELYYLRSFCDTHQHNRPQALTDVNKALSLGYKEVDTGYYRRLKTPGP
jgi:Flp pilus assembly protein TadD